MMDDAAPPSVPSAPKLAPGDFTDARPPQADGARTGPKEGEPKRARADGAVRRITEGPLALGVLRFGLPLVVGMALHTAFNLVDMVMVGQLPNGTAGLAALGLCDMVAALPTILSNGVGTATVALVSRRLGARDGHGVARATGQSLLVVVAMSAVFGAVGLLGSDAIVRGALQAKGEAANLAVAYLRVTLGGCFSIFVLLQITAILRAHGRGKSAAALLIAGNVLNALLNVFLIYGGGPMPGFLAAFEPVASFLQAPRLGVVGAAWATLIARTVPVLVGALLLVRGREFGFRVGALRPDCRELIELFRVAWPASAQFVLRVASILFVISLVSANYTDATDPSTLTAYGICLRLETMALFVGMGWGAAASTYVGMNLGAARYARARGATWIAAGYSVACMLGLTVVYLAFARDILGLFDPSPAVLEAGREYLWRTGATYAVLGLGIVLSQALAGAGATLPSLLLDAVALLGLTLPVAYVVTEVLGAPRTALWTALAAGNVVAAALFAMYAWRGRELRRPRAVGA
jgi:putative MATE family efflux protein